MTTETNALIFAGDLYVEFKDPTTGVFSAIESLEVEKFEIKTNNERKEKLSRRKATYNQPYVSYGLPQPSDFAITFGEVTGRIFALMLAASVENLSAAAAPFTDVEVTTVEDVWVPTGKTYISKSGFTVKNSAGDVTYVLGTDYAMDWELGLIKRLPGSAISAAVKLAGTTEAITGMRLKGAQNYNQVMRLKLNGINLVTKRRMILQAPQGSVASETAYDFMSGDFASAALTGRLEIASGWDCPYLLDYLD